MQLLLKMGRMSRLKSTVRDMADLCWVKPTTPNAAITRTAAAPNIALALPMSMQCVLLGGQAALRALSNI
jgi:hypothetical protein